jgi:hypothetical protein
MTDQDCIVEALQELSPKAKLRVSDQKQPVKGWGTAMAEIVIPRNTFGNGYAEMGFAKQKDGSYNLVAADHDARGLDMAALRRSYAERRTMKTAKAQGMKFVRKDQTVDKGGKVNVKLIFTAAANAR